MNELIQKIVDSVGLSPDVAEQAIKIVLNFLHTAGPSDLVGQLAGQLGLENMLGNAAETATGGGGLFGGGGLMGAIGGLIGGGTGNAMAAFSELSSAGLNMDQIQGLTKTFMDHGRETVGQDVIDQIVGQVPGLSQFI